MNRFTTAAFASLLFAGVALSAESKVGLGLAFTGQIPVGEFQEVAGVGLGGLAGIEAGAYPGLALTAHSGYIQHLEERHYSVNLVPIMGGLKLSQSDGGLYLAGEMGAVVTRVHYSGSVFVDDQNGTHLGWNLGVGSVSGPGDIRFSFNVWDAARMRETMTLGLTLGVTVWSL